MSKELDEIEEEMKETDKMIKEATIKLNEIR